MISPRFLFDNFSYYAIVRCSKPSKILFIHIMNDSFTLESLEERNADEDTLLNYPICDGRPSEVADPDYAEIVLMEYGALNHAPKNGQFFVAFGKTRKQKSLFSLPQRRSFCWNGFLRQMARRMCWPKNRCRKY